VGISHGHVKKKSAVPTPEFCMVMTKMNLMLYVISFFIGGAGAGIDKIK
jgi:hypothetical protein